MKPDDFSSVFFPSALVDRARQRSEGWAVHAKERMVAAAAPWKSMPYDDLWGLMFAPRLPRAWQVWSNGHCPVCKGDLPEYSWEIDPFARPWKVRCPHCREIFPKNDVAAFYRSGLDQHGEFDPERANRSLLVQQEAGAKHPDFGIDDGHGYTDGEHTWRFIAAYLIYGQWKQLIVQGVRKLAEAYLISGDADYARRALIILDRIADIYPRMDYAEQGLVYESKGHRGYVTVWHDAAVEINWLALAYDAVRPALAGADELVSFLGDKAKNHELLASKASAADIRRNIESNLLQHTIDHRARIESNFPCTDISVLTMHCVLDREGRREQVDAMTNEMLNRATAVDGVTGEKGVSGYSAWTFASMLEFLSYLEHLDPSGFEATVRAHPGIHRGIRFFMDAWCLQKYYPSCGDAGAFGLPMESFVCAPFERYSPDPKDSGHGFLEPAKVGARPSLVRLFWLLHRLTSDPSLVQILAHALDTPDGRLAFGFFHDASSADQGTFEVGSPGTELEFAL